MISIQITPSSGAANAEGVLQAPGSGFDTFANARAGTTSPAVALSNPTGEYSYFIGYSGGQYNLGHYYFKVDFSVIPAGSVINSIVLNFKGRFGTDNSTHIEDMVLVQGSQSNTLSTSNWTAVGTTSWGRFTQATVAAGGSQFQTLTLNATALAAITPGSVIKFALIHGSDFDNSAPGTGNAGAIMYTASATSPSDRPYLTVNYEPPGSLILAQI